MKSDRERHILYDLPCMSNLKKWSFIETDRRAVAVVIIQGYKGLIMQRD